MIRYYDYSVFLVLVFMLLYVNEALRKVFLQFLDNNGKSFLI